MSQISIQIKPGVAVVYKSRPAHISHLIDLNQVLLKDDETAQVVVALISDLQLSSSSIEFKLPPDLNAISDNEWNDANKRYQIILPLLNKEGRTRSDVEVRAADFNLHASTLYGWLREYEESGLLTALLPRKRKDKGSTKLSPEQEAIIEFSINELYLSKQRISVAKLITDIQKCCYQAKLVPPHANTIRNRVRNIDGQISVLKRRGRKAADAQYSPIRGEFPGADWPLAVIQIDHTKLDIILVDDLYRRPIGRPWITLAIDVYSRMVFGFYVSFDPPSALSTGLCLANAILPKDSWLAKHKVSGEWPCWGLPNKLHMDNAKEFRGFMLQKACLQYGIDIEWRPVARPHFGGHIERLLGTFSKEIHSLPGTTFSNTQERKDYDAEAEAVLTLTEFEEWLVTYVVNVYHQRNHTGIDMAPLEKYRRGIFGFGDVAGRGLPARINNELRLRLDLMPFIGRTIQDYGVVIDEIHYYHDVIRRWVDATDPTNPKHKRKFVFRRDPRDLSTIWFFDPELNDYFPIPYRNLTRPSISIWELRESKIRAESDGRRHIDENSIFDAYEQMKEIQQQAIAKTSAARRAVQRSKQASDEVLSTSTSNEVQSSPLNDSQTFSKKKNIKPFDELEELS